MSISTQPSQIYQIFYDENSREKLDPGFIALDNTPNERPDWREYWPIRQYLLTQALSKDTYYGFFSPKFFEKTGLDANAVYEFINQQSADTDVILFSPFFDQSAYFLNIFEQGAIAHPEIHTIFQQTVNLLGSPIHLSTLVMDSSVTVFCNFFVAKPRFWEVWLNACECIFKVAESQSTPLSNALNGLALHETEAAFKTFVIERIASLLLSTSSQFNLTAYPSIDLPLSNSKIRLEHEALVILDALKTAYRLHQNPKHLTVFKKIQQQILEKLQHQL